MKKLNDLLQELGISKVRLAKYLNVSRQMVYNYLELDDINKWPKEKKILLLKLLDIEDGEEGTIASINVTTDYLMSVENRINQGIKNGTPTETYIDLKDLSNDAQLLLTNIVSIIRKKLANNKKKDENYSAMSYLYNVLESMEEVPEIKYLFCYLSKNATKTRMEEYRFNEDKQFIFESIMYTALTLYNNGGASRSKLIEYHRRWERDVEQKKEEELGRTQQLTALKEQTLRELGYDKVTPENAQEFYEKYDELSSKKIKIENW